MNYVFGIDKKIIFLKTRQLYDHLHMNLDHFLPKLLPGSWIEDKKKKNGPNSVVPRGHVHCRIECWPNYLMNALCSLLCKK